MERPTLALTFEGEQAAFAKAFIAAQAATDAVKKASTNPAFRSKYADLSGVVEAVVPALNENKIGVMQFPAYDGELVHVTTLFLHESGASVRGTLSLRPSKTDPQGVGSAITYGRRYSLLAMSGAAPEDDDGNAASGPKQPANEAARTEARKPTLAERADRLAATLNGVRSEGDLRKAYDLASQLRAELDDKDPERLAELDALYETRFRALAEKDAA